MRNILTVISPALIFLTRLISVPTSLNSLYHPHVLSWGRFLPEGWKPGAEQWVRGTCLEGHKCAEMSPEDKCHGQQLGSSFCPCYSGLGRAVPELLCLHTTITSS